MIPITSVLIGVAIAIVAAMVMMLAYSFHPSGDEDVEKESETDREANLQRLHIYLKRRKHVVVADVERLLNVSETTARNYLETLATRGLLKPSNPRGRTTSYERVNE